MEIKLAEHSDLPEILDVINDAKNLLKKSGSLQWNTPDGYPQKDVFINDINERQLYILWDKEKICGIIVCIKGMDENYNVIEGRWITNGPYLTIHRIAVKKEYYHTGVSHKLINFAIEQAHQNNCKSIRVDTHPINIPMQKLLLRFKFEYCGEINLLNNQYDPKRLAYELII